MALRITTLSENIAARGGLLAEAGLGILLETEGLKILFDCGQSVSAVHNADALGIDLSGVTKIVLSHGHYDHTGGLKGVLRKIGKQVDVIAHPDIWQDKYACCKGKPDRYIGIPFPRSELEGLGACFRLSTEPVEITDNIMTTGEIPMITPFEQIDEGMFVREGSGWQPDKLLDDRALAIKTGEGLVVLLGCAHRGVINTLYHARQITGEEKIYAVIGGSHLIGAAEERLRRTAGCLRELGIQKLGLCHCTGLAAEAMLAGEFSRSFFYNNAGSVIQID
jgi:7,8-dihydropterin-6-yl-methyl-4-(beta-D-ribofuranosyl)aminobenzene 5'-phosphate synthase